MPLSFYQTKAWKLIRLEALARDNHLCQRHFALGQLRRAETVHHVREMEDYPELALDLANLQSLCKACHNHLHPDRMFRSKRKKTKRYRVRVEKA